MENLYRVTITDKVTYAQVQAENEAQAREIALEWWDERKPNIEVEKIEVVSDENTTLKTNLRNMLINFWCN